MATDCHRDMARMVSKLDKPFYHDSVARFDLRWLRTTRTFDGFVKPQLSAVAPKSTRIVRDMAEHSLGVSCCRL